MSIEAIADHESTRDLDEDRALNAIHRYIARPPQNSRVFVITPAMAKAILERYNKGNRKRKPGSITKYAEYMARDDWGLTGDTLKFSDRGILRDGQNRLYACYKANRAFTTHIVFGVPDELFVVMDRTHKRDGFDALFIESDGHRQNARQLQQAARWLKLITSDRVKMRDTFEPYQILEFVQQWPTLETRFLKHGLKIGKMTEQPAGMMAALLYAWNERDPDLTAEVIDAMTKNNLPGRMRPFRKALAVINDVRKASSGRVHDVYRVAVLIKAWNLVVANRIGRAADFEFDVAKDDVPQIEG